MNEYTPRQLASLLNVTPRQVTDMCCQGKLPGSYKNNKNQWRIPAEIALEVLAAREAEVEVLPPEGLAVVPREIAVAFVEGIVEAALVEERKKNREEVAALEKKVAELEERLTSEVVRKSEEVAELLGKTEQLEDHDRKFMEGLREVQRQLEEKKKKPGLVARVKGWFS
jgi:hypothetical protein